MEHECMLTTFDNPYDPFEQFDSWFLFDVEKGYNCCSYLARFVQIEDDLTQQEVNIMIENAIDRIIKYDDANIFKKATREISD